MSETSGGVAVKQARSQLSTMLEELLRLSQRLKTAEEEFEKLDRFIEREQAFQQCESTGEWIYALPESRQKICKTCNGTGEFRFSEDELSTVNCRECNGKGAGIVHEN